MRARAMVGAHARNDRLGRWLWQQNRLRGIARYVRPATAPIVRRLKAWNEAPVPELDPALRAALIPRFCADLDELAQLLDREIPWYRAGTDTLSG